ncbi:hypothetical protein CIK06_12715 [Plantactinospora sp. KBS50]|nr:hypothetical protein CIK06_12715 [Plantactinospora sp. KBS50]
MVLTAAVARRYFLDGRSKVEIAEEFQLSRFKVARLIASARASGIVRIEVGYPGAIDVELSARMQRRFGLRHCVVVDTGDDADPRGQLGRAAADLLSEIVTPDDVLGLAWSRAVGAMTARLRSLPTVPVVQLTGSLAEPDLDDSSVDLVRQAARVSGGPAHYFHAPLVVPTAATARAMRKQPEIARAFARFGAITTAVVGIGLWAPGQSTIFDAASDRDRRLVARLGGRAEISGVIIDADGTPLRANLTDRMIAISAAELGHVRDVVGIGYGVPKAPAVRAALRSGLLSGLVTHRALAADLLAGDG